MDKEQDPCICCLQETYLRSKTHRLKVRGWNKVFHAEGNEKTAGEQQYLYQAKYTLKERL